MTNKVLWVLAFAIVATDLFAQSNVPNSGGLVADGTIYSNTSQGDKLYIGGSFNYVGKNSPYLAKINKTTGETDLNFLKPNDIVYAIISDGNGGWYLGGAFTKIGDVTRNGLARINADGSLNSWDPNVTGSTAIKTLLMLNGRIYFGGRFTTVNGNVSRKNLAAVDTVAGTVLSWNPNMTTGNFVNSIVSSGANLYIGGNFTTFNTSVTRNRAAATDTTAGTLLSWDPNFNGTVNTMSVYGSSIYLGGSFSMVNSSTGRNRLAAVDLTTGTATSWNPNANAPINCITIDGNTLYAGGNFTSILSNTRTRLAAIDLTTGLLTNWAPTFSDQVWSIFPHSGMVYVGGQFNSSNSVNGTTYRNCVAAIDASNASVSNWNPSTQDIVYSMQANSTSIFMAGQFVSTGGDIRKNLAAVTVSTGTLDPNWKPVANGSIRSLIMNNNLVYAGGSFTTINSTARERLAAIDTSSGTLTSWDPKVVGSLVYAMTLNGNTLYVGGDFTTVNATNISRTNLAAFDTASGTVTSWNPSSNAAVRTMESSGSSIYIGGEFSNVNGNTSIIGLAKLDNSSGVLASGWNATLNGSVYSLLFYENKLYVGGNYSNINSTTRNKIAALNPSTGELYSWNPNASGTVWALKAIGSTLFMGGDFSTVGGVTRNRAASVDTSSGTLNSWNPNFDGSVYSFSYSNNYLHAGGGFNFIGGSSYRNLASFSIPSYPDAPLITGITSSSAQLSIAFSEPSNGGSAVTNYKYSLDNGATFISCSPAVTASPLTIAGLTNGTTYSIKIKAVNAFGDGAASAATNGTPQVSVNNWIGGTGNWNVAANWSGNAVPDGSTDITISSGVPTMDVDLTLASGKSFTLSGTGSLTIAAGKTLTIAGTADFGGKLVTFKSDATGTAQLGAVTGTLSNASNVTVERHIPSGKRAFRFFSPSVTTTTSILQNWMEGATPGMVAGYPYSTTSSFNPNPGYGTHITGAGGNANGFDATQLNNPSLFSFNNSTGAWAAVTSTAATLSAGTAYRMLVRGDRSYNMAATSEPAASATILRTNGTLAKGTLTTGTELPALSQSADGWSLVGNPYQAVVDMYSSDVVKNNLTNYYYIWDPRMASRGAYVAYNITMSSAGSNNLGSGMTRFLQPGQAFFVQNTTAGGNSLVFREAAKAGASNSTATFGSEKTSSALSFSSMSILLFYTDSLVKGMEPMDATRVLFGGQFSNQVDANDGRKFTNPDETMSIQRNGTNLSMELRSMPDTTTVLALNLSQYRVKRYTLRLIWDQPLQSNQLRAYLVDRYLHKETAIPSTGTTEVAYELDAQAGSSAADRFEVVFRSTDIQVAAIAGMPELCVGSTTKVYNATSGGSWRSNDTSVVRIDEMGTVTGVSAGTTAIGYTVTRNDISKTVQQLITVHSIPSKPQLSRDLNGQLRSSHLSENQWYRNNELIVGPTAAVYQPEKPGYYQSRAVQQGCASELSATYYYTTGRMLDEYTGSFVRMFPNPSVGEVKIEFRLDAEQKVRMEVYDMRGRMVMEKRELNSGAVLNIRGLSAGMYRFRILGSKGEELESYTIVKK